MALGFPPRTQPCACSEHAAGCSRRRRLMAPAIKGNSLEGRLPRMKALAHIDSNMVDGSLQEL